ncbi:MAG: hypothetical protein HUJ83_09175, partial [Veillonella sp.]|nr:hypothetical protein [Veillonella sp.]
PLSRLLIFVTASSMGKLQTVNKHLCPISKLIEATKVKIYIPTKHLFKEAAFAPVQINLNLAWGSDCFLKVYAVFITTFF